MPYTAEFEEMGVVHHFSGTVTFDQVIEAQNNKWNQDRAGYLKYTLLTFSDDVDFKLSLEEQALLLRRHDANQHSRAFMKFALVIQNEGIAEQLSGVLQDAKNVKNLDVRRFLSEAEARSWISQK